MSDHIAVLSRLMDVASVRRLNFEERQEFGDAIRELRPPQPVTPAMVERLSATVDRIEELNARQDERGRKLDSAVTPVVDGESFICYLIDNCEREVIHEESLHEWLADFLKNPRYHKPVTPAGGDVGPRTDRQMLLYLDYQFAGESWVCGRCGNEEPTNGCDSHIALQRHLYTSPTVAVDDAMIDRATAAFLKDNLVQRIVDRARMKAAIDAALNQRGGGA